MAQFKVGQFIIPRLAARESVLQAYEIVRQLLTDGGLSGRGALDPPRRSADIPRPPTDMLLEQLISDLRAQAQDPNLLPVARQAAEEIAAFTVEMDSAIPRREPWEPSRKWMSQTSPVVEREARPGRSKNSSHAAC